MSDADHLAQLAGKVAVLQGQVEAQDRILMALALSLPPSRRIELLELLSALQLNAAATLADADAARLMQPFVERFLTLTDPNLEAPVAQAKLRLHSQSLLFAATPGRQRRALETWLSQATPEEIAEELRDKLDPVLDAVAKAKKRTRRGSS